MRQIIVAPLAAAPVLPALGATVHELHGQTMGTTWCVKLVGHAAQRLDTLHAALARQLDDIVAQMSTWQPETDISRFNRAAPGTWQVLPDAFTTVLTGALAVARASGGAYDPTSGRLVTLWGFGPASPAQPRYDEPGFTPPSAAAIAQARAACGWQRIAFDPATQTVRQPGGVAGNVELDFSAIAKGYAVDALAACLHQHGIDHFLVEVGGELKGVGVRPDGQPWWVALEAPPDAAPGHDYLTALHHLAVATSGDYRRFFIDHGVRRPHTIDPRSGWPVSNRLASVSVWHEQCMLADAWSTALGVLGVEQGLALADRHDLAALFLTRDEDGSLRETSSRVLRNWLL